MGYPYRVATSSPHNGILTNARLHWIRAVARAFASFRLDRRTFNERHDWFTGGLAERSYLIADANLRIEKGGKVVGKTPYFNLTVSRGEVAHPPIFIELVCKFEPVWRYPGGRSWFASHDDTFLHYLALNC